MERILTSPAVFIQHLTRRGILLVDRGSRLLASPATLLTDDDRAAIRELKPALLALLAGQQDTPPPEPEPAPSATPRHRHHREWEPWAGADQELTEWFHAWNGHPPYDTPFSLGPGRTVAEPAKFFRALAADILAGSNGPRAAGLLDDLQRLRKLFD